MPDDRYYGGMGAAGPASVLFNITPNDNNDLVWLTTGVYVGVTGDLVTVDQGGRTVTFKNVVAGTVLPIRVARVKATGTTASSIVGLA